MGKTGLLFLNDGEFEDFNSRLLVAQHLENGIQDRNDSIPQFVHDTLLGDGHEFRFPLPSVPNAAFNMVQLLAPSFTSSFNFVESLGQRGQLFVHSLHALYTLSQGNIF